MTQYIRRMRAFLFTAFVATALVAAGAQDTSSGSISGTVTDSTGAVIKGATVRLINTDRGATIRTVTTNGSGLLTCRRISWSTRPLIS